MFPSKVQNLTVFSINFMLRIQFFGPRELIQEELGTAHYCDRNDQSVADNQFVRELMGHSQHWRSWSTVYMSSGRDQIRMRQKAEGVQSSCVDVDDGEIVCISLAFTVGSRTRAEK